MLRCNSGDTDSLVAGVPWPPSDQHTPNTGTKAEPAFIRKDDKSPLSPPLSSGLILQASQNAMAWSQWNTRYRKLGLELSLKQPISKSSLCHWGNNCSSNFCRTRSTMRNSRTPNTEVFPLSSVAWMPTTRSF
ncbi:uncharacterized protein TNCV_2852381 [Trichonephila clavipes]|nr:uncharacterized protein TNCV_2852381 [Trichonephila clavipes]